MTEQYKQNLIMTHEQFVTKETAKLAKQAGFDWGVQNFYKEGDDTLYTPAIIAMADNNWNMLDNTYSAPPQSVLQKWLREEKGYHIIIIHTYKTINSQNISIWGVLYENMSSLTRQNIQQLYDNLGNALAFYKFEEALEAGLQKCLRKIIENNNDYVVTRISPR